MKRWFVHEQVRCATLTASGEMEDFAVTDKTPVLLFDSEAEADAKAAELGWGWRSEPWPDTGFPYAETK